ncbi:MULTISPECIES: hypothetical protein [Roseomonadaceae]|uniref:Uncharacterized protein n=1 Tax=Falsiroseomonas oleicola TaxID=2801474 RepID=A0ABS6H776_9PROT|nr:hypothetical protein [Roseomonas oleicola]MBU8543341.1 hypothetical protein [Roseomonas oleicola]
MTAAGEAAVADVVEVTLVMTWSPAEPQGQDGHRIVFSLALDAHGMPDDAAYLADPAPWPARREAPEAPALFGDVVREEEGWALRLAIPGESLDEAPLCRLQALSGWLRPGSVVTIKEPNGTAAAWRVVAVG